MHCASTQRTDSAMIKDNRTIEQIVQSEIDRCDKLVQKRLASPRNWGKTVAVLTIRDIDRAKQAIKDNDANAMFHALRALRQNN